MHFSFNIKGLPYRERARVFRPKKGQKRALKVWSSRTPQVIEYQLAIAKAAKAAGLAKLSGPLSIAFVFTFAPAKSWPKWKRQAAMDGRLAHDIPPDRVNLEKALEDALQGICYANDAAIMHCHGSRKVWGAQDRINVEIIPLPGMISTSLTKPIEAPMNNPPVRNRRPAGTLADIASQNFTPARGRPARTATVEAPASEPAQDKPARVRVVFTLKGQRTTKTDMMARIKQDATTHKATDYAHWDDIYCDLEEALKGKGEKYDQAFDELVALFPEGYSPPAEESAGEAQGEAQGDDQAQGDDAPQEPFEQAERGALADDTEIDPDGYDDFDPLDNDPPIPGTVHVPLPIAPRYKPGRKRLFKDAFDLSDRVNRYFEFLNAAQRAPTLTGMALYLGFNSLPSFQRYRSGTMDVESDDGAGDFSGVLEAATLAISSYHEERCASMDTTPAGSKHLLSALNRGFFAETTHSNVTLGGSVQGPPLAVNVSWVAPDQADSEEN